MTRPLVLAAGSMLDCDAATLIDAAGDAGFDGVGLRVPDPHGTVDRGATGHRAASGGVAVHDVEVVRIGGPSCDAHADALMDAAVDLGASAVLVVSDVADRARTVDELGRLAARCGDRGLRLGLEYMAWTMPSSPAAAIEIAAETGCVLVVDVLHHVRVGAGPDELDAIVGSGRLGWVQLCDAALAPVDDLVGEARHDRLPPGEGELPLAALLARLPPDTLVSVEVQSDALLAMAPFDRAVRLHDAARRVLDAAP